MNNRKSPAPAGNGTVVASSSRNEAAPSFDAASTRPRVGATKVALFFVFLLSIPALLLADSDGKWLHRVPDEDHTRTSPVAGQAKAAESGKVIFEQNCAKCHGIGGVGLHNRPSLRSQRVRNASDGDLAWMLKNGNPYKGMPPWSSLPEQQRWQIIAYLRTLPAATQTGEKP